MHNLFSHDVILFLTKVKLIFVLRYWDLRQQTPTWVQRLPDLCYALAVQHPLVVVGTADRNIIVFNLQSPQVLNRSSNFYV